jgi:Fe2+ transport system protein FeoA
MTHKGPIFNPPPGWPKPPAGWVPPKGWTPDPAWPPPPPGWQLWLGVDSAESSADSAGTPDPRSELSTETASASGMPPDSRVVLLEAENAALRARLEAIGTNADTVVELNDERVLQDVGIYRYHHPLENAVAYRERLDGVGARIAELVKAGTAIEKSNMFTFDGSLSKGRTFTNDLARLMLRAYNAEAENVVRTLRVGNLQTAIRRLEASRVAIAKLGKMMEMRISDAFHALRIEEIELTADYLELIS